MTRPSSKSLNFCSNNLSFLELIGHLFIMKLNQTLNFNFEMFYTYTQNTTQILPRYPRKSNHFMKFYLAKLLKNLLWLENE